MQLPIDVKALIDEATNIDEASRTPVSLSLYIDVTCQVDLLAAVLGAFGTQAPHARVSQCSLEDALAAPYPGDDAAIIVAGDDERVGLACAVVRSAGVPCMVVSDSPATALVTARESGHPIPDGDMVAPGGSPVPVLKRLTDGLRGKVSSGGVVYSRDEEPVPLDEEALVQLNQRMGAWIIASCREKRLAFALAFPFVRRPLSLEAVGATSVQNAGVGLVVLLPGADMPVMTLNQAKMLLQIAAAYGQPMSLARVKELIALLGGAFACRSVARQLAAVVPALGWAVKAGVGYTGTAAMGRAAIEYFEAGGSVSGLAEAFGKVRDAVSQGAERVQAVAAGVAEAACAPSSGVHTAVVEGGDRA